MAARGPSDSLSQDCWHRAGVSCFVRAGDELGGGWKDAGRVEPSPTTCTRKSAPLDPHALALSCEVERATLNAPAARRGVHDRLLA